MDPYVVATTIHRLNPNLTSELVGTLSEQDVTALAQKVLGNYTTGAVIACMEREKISPIVTPPTLKRLVHEGHHSAKALLCVKAFLKSLLQDYPPPSTQMDPMGGWSYASAGSMSSSSSSATSFSNGSISLL